VFATKALSAASAALDAFMETVPAALKAEPTKDVRSEFGYNS
jgi:hypothetical protein